MKILLIFLLFTFPAQTGHTQTKIDRDSFSLQYPAKWTIDTEDEDYDPDALFSIDSPDGDNMIMFVIYDLGLDTADLMKEQVKAFTAELIKKPEISHFNTWGKWFRQNTERKADGSVQRICTHICLYRWQENHDSGRTML